MEWIELSHYLLHPPPHVSPAEDLDFLHSGSVLYEKESVKLSILLKPGLRSLEPLSCHDLLVRASHEPISDSRWGK